MNPLMENATERANRLLTLAIREGSEEGVWRALRDGAQPEDNYRDLLLWACRGGHIELVQHVLKIARMEPRHLHFALESASSHGHVDVVDRLLKDERTDPSVPTQVPIQKACCLGYVKVVNRLLQDPRTDPFAGDWCALMYACNQGHLEVLERLLRDARITSDLCGQAMYAAMENNYYDVVQRLALYGRVDPATYIRVMETIWELPIHTYPPHRHTLVQYARRPKSTFQKGVERLFAGEQHLLDRIATCVGPVALQRLRTFFDFCVS